MWILGAVALAVIAGVEIYSYGLASAGRAAPDILKLSYLALFVWLLLESRKARLVAE